MTDYRNRVNQTAEFLRKKIKSMPVVGLLTGTGLGESADSIDKTDVLDYSEIPNFPISTVEGHSGRLIFGKMEGKNIVAMQGRFHLYEGYSAMEVAFPIRVMQALGVKIIIISNASGGLNLNFNTGDIMIIDDHINLTGDNPLVGDNVDSWGKRFPDMINAYDRELIRTAEAAAFKTGVSIQKGVYAGLKGPSLETPAEMRFLKTIGSDTVGFSTITEVIAAVHGGIKVLGLATITNINDPDNAVPATIEEIIESANDVAPRLESLIRDVVRTLEV